MFLGSTDWRHRSGCPDAFQEHAGGLVVWILGDQFSAKCFGQDRLREAVYVRSCRLFSHTASSYRYF